LPFWNGLARFEIWLPNTNLSICKTQLTGKQYKNILNKAQGNIEK